MKVILFFNNQRGLSILNSLVKRNVDVKFVFLSKKNLNTKVYKEVLKQNIPSLKVIKINSEKVKKIIKKIQPDLNIVAGFPYIINKKIYEIPKYGTVNLHAGKLPEYRGGSPLNWQIINGEKKIGISLIQLNQKLDAGKIICSKEFELKKDYDIKKVHELANKHFILLTFEAINKLLKKKNFRKQNIKKAKYWKQRKESDGLLDFKNMSDKNVYNFVRAITEPYPCAFVKIKRKKLKIIKCKIYKKNLDIYPGQIFYDKKRIYLGCKKGIIEVIKHQYENS